MPLFYTPDIRLPLHKLDEPQSRHAVKVLRLRAGDGVRLTDGRGNMYEGAVEQASPTGCVIRVTGCEQEYGKRPYRLTMAVSPTKNPDRYQWFLEKATEAGYDRFIPLLAERSERRVFRAERGLRVITSAVQQCLNAYHPELAEPEDLAGLLSRGFSGQKFIAHCDQAYPRRHIADVIVPGGDYLVLIGPEGDFSPAEIEAATAAGFEGVSLGGNRLRTETAALYAVVAASIINR